MAKEEEVENTTERTDPEGDTTREMASPSAVHEKPPEEPPGADSAERDPNDDSTSGAIAEQTHNPENAPQAGKMTAIAPQQSIQAPPIVGQATAFGIIPGTPNGKMQVPYSGMPFGYPVAPGVAQIATDPAAAMLIAKGYSLPNATMYPAMHQAAATPVNHQHPPMVQLPADVDPSIAKALQQPPSNVCYCGYAVDRRIFNPRPPIPCSSCNAIFHFECIPALRKLLFVPLLGDDFFQYKCAKCGEGKEQLKRMHMSWPDVLHLVMFHLTHSGYPTEHVEQQTKLFQIKQDICPLIDKNWGSFWGKSKTSTWTNSIASALSTSTPSRFISGKSLPSGLSGWWALAQPYAYPSMYESKRTRIPQYDISDDGSFIRMSTEKGKRPRANTQESDSSATSSTSMLKKSKRDTGSSDATKVKEAKEENMEKKKRGRRFQADENDDRAVTMLFLDVPDEDIPVRMSRRAFHTAPQVNVGDDGLTVSNDKGYRLCKATHGVSSGCWFFEVEILEPKTSVGNLRIGWSQISGDLQAPCGYDAFSYSYRASPPSLFHQSRGRPFGKGFKKGDILGVMIDLRDGEFENTENYDIIPEPWDGESDYEQVAYRGPRPTISRSEIRFYVNGEDQGLAFTEVFAGKYHPAISAYMGGHAKVNFGEEEFRYPPSTGTHHYRAFSEARSLVKTDQTMLNDEKPPVEPENMVDEVQASDKAIDDVDVEMKLETEEDETES